MPNLLAIESTGQYCSVALLSKGLINEEKDSLINRHSSILHQLIDQLCKSQDVAPQDLDAVVLSAGPGSYTGLRVGSSTAKGICIAQSIPLISISTHHSMLYSKEFSSKERENERFICLTDARRNDVFYSVYENNTLLKGVEVTDINNETWQEFISSKSSLVVGSGSEKLQKLGLKNLKYQIGEKLSAMQLLDLGVQYYEREQFEDIINYEPRYEKEFYTITSPK